jgi:two-component system CheB/CheR fusion protein
MKKPAKKVKQTTPKTFPIVAIGASAGGLEAVTELIKNLPADSGMTFVYIQHLAPKHESLLPEILKKVTSMNVVQARHRLTMKPDHIYIIPPAKDMSVKQGALMLDSRSGTRTMHMPIDKFFISLAENHPEMAVGVLLSGNASDGTIGLKAIKAAGGVTFAQDDSAKFPGMPKSAISEGVVDRVMAPKKIAQELVRLDRQRKLLKIDQPIDQHEEVTENDLEQILQLLRKSLGVDFSHYKVTTIKRRILRRMLLYKILSLRAYHAYLLQHTDEITTLFNDLLINVTSFFRDPEAMEYIKKSLLPKLLKNKSTNNPLRIWVPACSTGEEAYSIGMLVMEVLSEKISSVEVQIFASDLSEIAINKARLGVYSPSEIAGVSLRRLQNFFTKTEGGYRITKPLRDMCVFAPHNIFKDPPFSKLDLITCCNLMIYMDNVLQKRIITTFHYALNRGGYLMVGKSETVSASPQLFTQVEKRFKIYSRKGEPASISQFEVHPKITREGRGKDVDAKKIISKDHTGGVSLDRIVENILLENYIPASVVITEDLEIVQFRGSTGMFLEPSPGKASLNLLKMARPGLAFELRNVVHKANRSGQVVRKTGITIKHKHETIDLAIEVVPLKTGGDEKFFLVLFEELSLRYVPASKSSLTKDKLVQKLEAELSAAKEDMHSFVAEQEATNEELQSANEEIVSSNEELQSINEELETSKEEIESTNEELMTINSELQVRNDQLTESYEYSEAIFEIIREAVLVLTWDLRVKFANKAFYRIFGTGQAETEGVYVFELGDKQWNIPKLREVLNDVQEKNYEFHGFEVRHVFPKVGEKIMILHGKSIIQKNHKQQLILLAIEDVTDHTFGQRIVAEREAWMRDVADNLPVIVWVVNAQRACTFLNNTWYQFTGNVRVNLNWEEIVHPDDLGNFLKDYTLGFNSQKSFTIEFRMRSKDGEYSWMFMLAKPRFSGADEFIGYIGTLTNIQHQKTFAGQLEQNVLERTHLLTEANKKLEETNDELRQLAYVASHDLQEPLRKITTFSDQAIRQLEANNASELRDSLTKNIQLSRRVSMLVTDLLNFLRSTRTETNFVPVDLNEIYKTVLTDLDLSTYSKELVIDKQSLPVVEAIPKQMQQLLYNLLSNALKFTEMKERPNILISSKKLKKEEVPLTLEPSLKYVHIAIQDNGIGFETRFADQIFVIFRRLHDKEHFPGTGIGLALCKKIVSNHDGLIYAESKPDDGASFHIILPISR